MRTKAAHGSMGRFPHPLADAEGGMVMLETSGDANDSVFDLSGWRTTSRICSVRAGVEAAVGFYQAMDVATDEVPTADVPAANTEFESARHGERTIASRHKAKGTSPNNAAAAVGATILVGAAVDRPTRPDGVDAAQGGRDKRRRALRRNFSS